MQALRDWQLARFEDVSQLASIAQTAWAERQLPAPESVPQSALYTALGSLLAGQLLLLLALPRARAVLLAAADTVAAVVLLGLLLAAILCLPLGAVYIAVRGGLLMARSLADTFPPLAAVLRPLLLLVAGGAARGEAGGEAAAGAGGGAAAVAETAAASAAAAAAEGALLDAH